MNNFSRVGGLVAYQPGTPEHAVLENTLTPRTEHKAKQPTPRIVSRYYYDMVAATYNSLQVNGLVKVAPPIPVSNNNLRTVLERRGVQEGVDYLIVVPPRKMREGRVTDLMQPRYLKRISGAKIRSVMPVPDRDQVNALARSLSDMISTQQRKLNLLLTTLPNRMAKDRASLEKLDVWLRTEENDNKTPIDVLLAELTVPAPVEPGVEAPPAPIDEEELIKLRAAAAAQALELQALGVMQRRLNSQVGGEVVKFGPLRGSS